VFESPLETSVADLKASGCDRRPRPSRVEDDKINRALAEIQNRGRIMAVSTASDDERPSIYRTWIIAARETTARRQAVRSFRLGDCRYKPHFVHESAGRLLTGLITATSVNILRQRCIWWLSRSKRRCRCAIKLTAQVILGIVSDDLKAGQSYRVHASWHGAHGPCKHCQRRLFAVGPGRLG